MGKAILIVLDSLGVGGAPDANLYNDEGSNTFGSIAWPVQMAMRILDGREH